MKQSSVRSLALAAALLSTAACAGTPSPVATVPGPEPSGLFPSDLSGRFEVVGRGAVTNTHTSDLWVFEAPNGRDYVYTSTWGACEGCVGDRMYVWDVTEPSSPVLADSVMVDARVANDIKVNEAGTVAVLTREGASDRRNGIIVLDLADPAHPTVASNYFEGLTGGVHNVYISGNYVYATNNGTRSLNIIDISNPSAPRTVATWGVPLEESPDRYLHDVFVKDGLAYLSYWDDGMIILDVGNGIEGGSPANPQLVSQYAYTTEWQGNEYGNTHTVYVYTNEAGNTYAFVGDEIFPANNDPLKETIPGGYVHVIDVSDIENPVEVAKYEVPGAGVHNLWVENDILYTAYYNGGLRAVDVSGELEGNLRAQGREIAVLRTSDDDAFLDDLPFAWGPQVHEGLVYASDYNSGLWIARLIQGAE